MENEEIQIDLNIAKSGKLDEFSILTHMGTKIEILLKAMFGFGGPGLLGSVTGTRSQVNSFYKALRGEKRHMSALLRHGLTDPRTMRSRHSLDKAIRGFENDTGLKWPVR
jgi:hypothetical protein